MACWLPKPSHINLTGVGISSTGSYCIHPGDHITCSIFQAIKWGRISHFWNHWSTKVNLKFWLPETLRCSLGLTKPGSLELTGPTLQIDLKLSCTSCQNSMRLKISLSPLQDFERSDRRRNVAVVHGHWATIFTVGINGYCVQGYKGFTNNGLVIITPAQSPVIASIWRIH